MRSPISRFERLAAYFILLACLTLAVLIVVPRWERQGFVLVVEAKDAIELGSGDEVMMNGIQIGEVAWVDLTNATEGAEKKVEITCVIRRKFAGRLTQNSVVHLVPAGLFGRGNIAILPGTGDPLRSGQKVAGLPQESVMDRVDRGLDQWNTTLKKLDVSLVTAGSTLDGIDQGVVELKGTLDSFQEVLDKVNTGEGPLGRLIYDDELLDPITGVISSLQTSVNTINLIGERLIRLSAELTSRSEQAGELLGKLSAPIDSMGSAMKGLEGGMVGFEKGMMHFPEMTSKLVASLTEVRKILESMKRNVLIRGNIPRDTKPGTMAPASRREPVSED